MSARPERIASLWLFSAIITSSSGLAISRHQASAVADLAIAACWRHEFDHRDFVGGLLPWPVNGATCDQQLANAWRLLLSIDRNGKAIRELEALALLDSFRLEAEASGYAIALESGQPEPGDCGRPAEWRTLTTGELERMELEHLERLRNGEPPHRLGH